MISLMRYVALTLLFFSFNNSAFSHDDVELRYKNSKITNCLDLFIYKIFTLGKKINKIDKAICWEIVPTEFIMLLFCKSRELPDYLYFEDYVAHASLLLRKYLKQFPSIPVKLSSKKFVEAALIAALITIKYAEDDAFWLEDLIKITDGLCPNLFKFEEMHSLEIKFLASINWEVAFKLEKDV